jgi:hypothetical protein
MCIRDSSISVIAQKSIIFFVRNLLAKDIDKYSYCVYNQLTDTQ